MSETKKLLENYQRNLNENALDLELSPDEEAIYDELTARNLAEEFKALSKEQQQEYLDCIPVNGSKLSRETVNELANKYNLDDTLLYWVVNIRDLQEAEVENKSDLQSDIEDINATFTDLEDRLITDEAKNIMQDVWVILADRLNELEDSIDTSDIIG